jgi:hypothetical protein
VVGGGWQVGVDSTEAAPWHGPVLGVGVVVESWYVGAFGSYALAREISDSLTRLRVTRSEVSARLARHFGSQSVRAEVGGRLGVLAYDRSTEARAADVAATTDRRSLGPVLALEGAARLALSTALPVELVIALGVDGVPRAPVLKYDRGDADTERARLWPLQPRASVRLELGPRIF